MKNIKNTFLGAFSEEYRKLKEDIQSKKRITGVDKEYYQLACNLLSEVVEKTVWLLENSNNEKQQDFEHIMIVKDTLLELDRLIELGYERVERVWNEGEISILGDVVIIWPFGMDKLVRVSLSGDDIEEISFVDRETRKKIQSKQAVTLLGPNSNMHVGSEDFKDNIQIKVVEDIFNSDDLVDISIKRIPGLESFTSRKAVIEIVRNFKRRNYKVWYLTNRIDGYELSVEKEMREYIGGIYIANNPLEKNLRQGFVSEVAKIVVLTDLEVLGEVDLSAYQEKNIKTDPSSVEILKKILPGDYIVHEDHGIGEFVGIIYKEKGPYMKVAYAGQDKLYIPLTASEKITKYIGAGKRKPRLTGLNSRVWQRISQKAKERVEDIAKELLQLYALRESTKNRSVILTPHLLNDLNTFIGQFEFDDTDDQILSTEHIIEDLGQEKPMDRLLVGDVGYGKTEIAARAIFAVVNAGYQVALLAPTTILTQQHKAVLTERFKYYPFNIASLSRFSTLKEKEEVLSKLEKGVVDIVIGTHSLLSNSVKFKNLGLLVIDEEQKFGVKQKENIKTKRIDTNILSLTATPIPRTLNMALMGVRDISVLATPPLGRKEIVNTFSKFDWEVIEEAIKKELARGGQVYFLHNRVNTIEYVYSKLEKIFPKAKISLAHGQMGVAKLSKNMNDFIEQKSDILLCTTIIENGLDIATANTLIVDDISLLGLSQMYQIRGRIGRSEKQAYAYFLFKNLRGNAQQRLEALKESQALGSGFLLSNRDLEIRGAGDILGKNQSGTINSVGYGLYSQMLEYAVKKLQYLDK